MENPAWLLDELTHAGAEHLDAAYAVAYTRKAAFDPAEDIALLRSLGLGETSTLVDIGAGTGAFVLEAAPFCRRVVAVDISEAMLDVLRREAEQQGIENVEAVRGGFLTYRHEGTPADFVYSRNALHHLPDFWKALALEHIAAILRAKGVLRLRDLVFSFEPREAEEALERWLANSAPDAGFSREELEEHIREEHSTFSWLLEPMLERAGFVIQDAWYAESQAYARYICVTR